VIVCEVPRRRGEERVPFVLLLGGAGHRVFAGGRCCTIAIGSVAFCGIFIKSLSSNIFWDPDPQTQVVMANSLVILGAKSLDSPGRQKRKYKYWF